MAIFGVWDYAVLITVLVISASIGIYYRFSGGKQKTTKEYLMADHSMSPYPVSFSLMASFMSAITVLGISNESYQFGIMFSTIGIAYIVSTPIISRLYLPVFYRMRATSAYEYLERRFGQGMRLMASLAFSAQTILYMGVVLYAPALALEVLTGINHVTAIFLIGSVCTFYSTLGGMKAVLITDVFQTLLMYAATISVIAVCVIKAGGFEPIWLAAKETGRLNLSEISFDPTIRHTWWSSMLGGMVTHVAIYGVNQTQVQRLLSVRNLKGAQASLWWALPLTSFFNISAVLCGLAMYYYYRNCDPLLDGRIKSRDQLMPLFAIDTMGQYPGLCGLFVSGVFSASLSTVSSAVSSLCAVTLEDYLKPLYRKIFKTAMPESKTTLPTKIIACIYGIICILLALSAGSLGNLFRASLVIIGIIGGPLLAVFTLGMCTVRANQKGVMLGLLCGLAFSFWIGFGGPKPPPSILPLSNDGCEIKNSTLMAEPLRVVDEFLNSTITTTTEKNLPVVDEFLNSTITTTTEKNLPVQRKYFWLYRLSHMWFSVLGFIVTLICGYLFSRIFECLNWADNSQMYMDVSRKQIDYDLFVLPLSRKLQMQAAVAEDLGKIKYFNSIS